MTVPITLENLHQELVRTLERAGIAPSSLTRSDVLARSHDILAELKLAGSVEAEASNLAEQLANRVLGLGALENLLADASVTEIMINGLASSYVERAGILYRLPPLYNNESEILQVINRIVGRVGRRIDESSPLVDARLPDGSRVNAIIAPLSRIGPVLTIRRFPAEQLSLQHLTARGALSPKLAAFLAAAVQAKFNIIISGSTGSGKTTLLNALAATVSESERLITIEDTAEIKLAHPHLVALEARAPNLEGEGEVTMRALLKNALRMRPDRIIIGEVRGGEALDMLQAMNTGHQGSLCTVHANAAEEALLRLETMATMADVNLPLPAVRAQVKAAVQIIIQQERLLDGSRRVVAVDEVLSDRDQGELAPYRLRPLFRFNKQTGRFEPGKNLPERLTQFENLRVPVELDWFTAN